MTSDVDERPADEAATRREVPGFCTFCRSRCGSLSVIEGDRLVAVKPLPGHPTGKALCPKGRAAPEIVHSPRRLSHPLRRTRPKGEADPGWQQISWDEALDEIVAKLATIAAESGPEAVAFALTSPSATSVSDAIGWIERFIWSFGSPNVVYATELCNWHKDHAHAFTYGVGLPVPDYRNTELIVLWGHNPTNVWLAQAEAIGAGRRRGARLVVIDPRRTALAGEADLWLGIRPGTDGALALAVSRILIDSGRYDADFVRRWTNAPFLVRSDDGRFLRGRDAGIGGPDDYVAWDEATASPVAYDPREGVTPDRARGLALGGSVRVGGIACRPAFAIHRAALDPFTLDRVARSTGLTESGIADLAAEIATARSLAYYGWTGIGQHANATQTDRAVALLFALTGQFDAPGGNVLWSSQPVNPVSDYGAMSAVQRAKAIGLTDRPLGPPSQGWITGPDFYRAVLDADPYRVRALFGFGSNLLVSQPDAALGRRALRDLEFQVHCDVFMNPTAEMADIVLPVGTAFEREGLRAGFEIGPEAQDLIQLRPAMLAAMGASRSDAAIVFDLAERLGMGERFFGGDIEAGLAHILAPTGLTLEALRAHPEGIARPLRHRYRKYAERGRDGLAGFATPTRRVEVYSERLVDHGEAAVPGASARLRAALEPRGAGRWPFTVTTAKNGHYCQSQHRGIASLRLRAFAPTLDVSAATASARGIRTGDGVVIRSAVGEVRMVARIDPHLLPDVAVAEYGWWQACPDIGAGGGEVLGGRDWSFNSLVGSDDTDPVSGAPRFRSLPCDIVRDEAVVPGWMGDRRFRVDRISPEGHGIAALDLVPEDGGALPPFDPGQFLTIDLGAACGGGSRSYSLAGSGRAPQAYRIAVKRVPGGRASRHLVEAARIGDIIEARAPAGRFRLPVANAFPVVLIAGGIGITPFLSLLETLAGRDEPRPELKLHYAVRNRSEHAFRARIAALAAAIPRLEITTWYSRPGPDDRPGIAFDRAGRLTASAFDPDLLARRPRFYLCGPDGLMDALARDLAKAGVHRFEIFRERFAAPPPPPMPPPGSTFAIRFARTGRELAWTEASGSLLDLAERAGIPISAGCRTGQCASCTATVLSGAVVQSVEDEGLQPGECLTCRAYPASDLVLDA